MLLAVRLVKVDWCVLNRPSCSGQSFVSQIVSLFPLFVWFGIVTKSFVWRRYSGAVGVRSVVRLTRVIDGLKRTNQFLRVLQP